MKSEWTDYPISIFVAAFRSTAGGILTLMLALSIATWIGHFTFYGNFYSPMDVSECLMSFIMFVGPICIACLQFWGFLYICLIFWSVYQLVHQDAPRLRIAAFMMLPQFTCTVVAFGVLEGFDADILLRVGIATPVVTLISAAPLVIDRVWRRNQPTTT